MSDSSLAEIVQSGLAPAPVAQKRVLVVGAGMAGLVAAYELTRAGYAVTVLEASTRAGGRVLTVREPFDQGLHSEAGAMRIPMAHELTLAYARRFGLSLIPFTTANPHSILALDGRRITRAALHADGAGAHSIDSPDPSNPAIMAFWSRFIQDTGRQLAADPSGYGSLVAEYGDLSLFEFFRRAGWSTDAITTLSVMEAIEPMLSRSFLEMLQVELQWLGSSMAQIEGGMDHLPQAFRAELVPNIVFGAEMIALDYTAESVTIQARTRNGIEPFTADFAIVTVPFSVLRFVDFVQPFSFGKQMAIRQLHYADAVKIMLQCRRRFWEEDEGIYGGMSVTDQPNRLVYYPDHGRATGKGVLMGCYTYGEEANRWAALSPEERIQQAVRLVSRLHPQIESEFEVGVSKVWGQDRYAAGAFAFFEAGQQSRLLPHMIAPEGPVHFAGEHTSLKHMWIEGAVESALRACKEINDRVLMTQPGRMAVVD